MSAARAAAFGSEGFDKSARLRKRREFLRLRASGSKLQSVHLIALFSPSLASTARLGITVSGKVGNSVERNRIKRAIREIFRKNRGALARSVDLVLIAKPIAARASFAELEQEFRALARKIAVAPDARPRGRRGEGQGR